MNTESLLKVIAQQLIIMNQMKAYELRLKTETAFQDVDPADEILDWENQIHEDNKYVRD